MKEPAVRLAWVDTAKASAVILVVLYHVAVQGGLLLLPDSESKIVANWATFSNALVPIRMPAFFLASGILAANAVTRPWRLLWRPRILNLLWPFLLWSILFSIVVAPQYRPDNPKSYMIESLQTIRFGGNAYWFLSVLVLFFVIAKVFRNRLSFVLIVAVVLFMMASLSSSLLIGHFGIPESLASNLSRISRFAVWYFLGLVARDQLVRAEDHVRIYVAVMSITLYCVLAYFFYFDGALQSISVVMYQMLSVIGIVGVIHLAIFAAKSKRFAKFAVYLSRRTLAIYVLHPILLSLFIIIVRRGPDETFIPVNNMLIDILLFPIVTALLVAASVGIYDLVQRIGWRWLFAFPGGPKRSPAPGSSARV